MQGPKQDTDPLPSENSGADPKKFIPDPQHWQKDRIQDCEYTSTQ